MARCQTREGQARHLGYHVSRVLDELHQQRGISVIIHGAARGADAAADAWTLRNCIEVRRYPVFDWEWKSFGRRAGVMRNQRMLDSERVDLVVAFPGHEGTADMVKRAERAGIEVEDLRHKSQLKLF